MLENPSQSLVGSSPEPATAFGLTRDLVGVVVIGRNEGDRLRRCLASVRPGASMAVYVDSGSSDGSVDAARSAGVGVVTLDMSLPFTAARARNEGFAFLRRLTPHLAFVQFVDGDCEVAPEWFQTAAAFLDANPRVAVACGRRRERFPDRSVYNLLCDLEWNTPIGPARACGGDALMRAAAVAEVGGYRDDLIAGEEPELCLRLRAKGWQVWRLDAEMTLHDAAMTRFGQWWKRSQRSGFAFAQGAQLHGASPERHWVRESRSAWLWGLALPVALLLLGAIWHAAFWGFLIYPLQVLRLFLRETGTVKVRSARGFFLMLGKFAEVIGQAKFQLQRFKGEQARLIEYK